MSEQVYEFGSPPAAQVPAPAAAALVAPAPTVLDGLLDALDREIGKQSVTLGVQARPGWEVRYSVDIPYEQRAQWQQAAADPAMPLGFNEVQVAAVALAACCQAIVCDGEDVTDTAGPVTFASPDLQRRLGVARPVDAVRKLYRFDGHVLASGNELMREAGYGQGATPTKR
jgi:hypothetical protein